MEFFEAALEVGDGAETGLRVFAKFGDGLVTGEGFLSGERDFEFAEFRDGSRGASGLAFFVGEAGGVSLKAWARSPWVMALRAQFSLPSSIMGPWDLTPFSRAISALRSFEIMVFSVFENGKAPVCSSLGGEGAEALFPFLL